MTVFQILQGSFSLFCNFSASHSIATPAVNFVFYFYWNMHYYWNCDIIELLKFCKELNKLSVMNKTACSVVICQPSGHEQKHNSMNGQEKVYVYVHVVYLKVQTSLGSGYHWEMIRTAINQTNCFFKSDTADGKLVNVRELPNF